MDGKNALNLLKDRRFLVIIVAVIIIIAAVAYVVLSGDDDGGNDGPSDGLTITGEQTFTDDRVVEGTLTIEADSKLTLNDGVSLRMVGPDAKIVVMGTFDASKGHVSFVTQNEDGSYTEVNTNATGESRSITVSGNGEMIVEGNNFESVGHFDDSSGIKNFVNAATYDAEPNVHITTLAKALAAEGDVTLHGQMNDTTAVTADGDTIVIEEGASVTLGSISLTNSASVNALGSVTANVSNGTNTVGLSGVSGLTVTSGASGLLALDGTMRGSLTISSGTVYIDSVDATAGTVTVSQNATMALEDTTALDGILKVGEDQNDLLVSGIIAVGTKPTTLPVTGSATTGISGLITLDATGFVKVYAGVSGFDLGDDVKNTAFRVDGDLYMTAYGSATIASVIASEDVASGIVSNAADFKIVSNWNNTENMSGDAVTAETKIGDTEFGTVYYATVKVTLSLTIPSSVTLLIDDEIVSGSSITLAAGTHDYEIRTNGSYVFSIDGNNGSSNTGTFQVSSSSKDITVSEATETPADSPADENTSENGGDN